MVFQIIPMSRKKTLIEHKNRLRPSANKANKIMHGKISNNCRLYTSPAQYIMTKNTTKVISKLKSSPIVSDNGKNSGGMLSDFRRPAEPTMLPTDCPVTFEKKNQSINPDVTNRT
jgi:hypothetical protein